MLRRLRLAICLAVVLAIPGCGPGASAVTTIAPGVSGLSDLQGLEELKAAFNRDVGTVRLVLLLSPT